MMRKTYHCVPRNGCVGVCGNQFVRDMVQIALFVQLDKHRAKQWNYIKVVAIFVDYLFATLVCFHKLRLSK